MYRCVFLLSLPFLSVSLQADDAASYHRYLECEDMTAEGVGNPIRVDAEPVRFSTAMTYLKGPNPLLEPTLAALEQMQTRPLVRIEPQTAIDPDTGQYVLEVRVSNRGDGLLSGVAQLEPASPPSSALR